MAKKKDDKQQTTTDVNPIAKNTLARDMTPDVDSIVMMYLNGIAVNPDPIFKLVPMQRYAVYDDMKLDAEVGSRLEERKDAVIALSRRVVPASDAQVDLDAAELVEKMIDDFYKWDQFVRNIMSCQDYGLSVIETEWNVETYMPVRGHYRPPSTFLFDDKERLHWLNKNDPVEGKIVPKEKFVITTFGNGVYGEAVLQRAYWSWRIKKEFIRLKARYGAEKAGSYLLVKLNEAVSTGDPEAKELLKSLGKIMENRYGILPDWVDSAEMLSSDTSGVGTFYDVSIEYFDAQIAKAIIGQTASSKDAKGGLGGKQEGQALTKSDKAMSDGRLVSEALDGLVKQMLVYHFNVEEYPRIEFYADKKIAAQELAPTVTAIQGMAATGWKFNKQEITDRTGFTFETDEENLFVALPPQASTPFGKEPGGLPGTADAGGEAGDINTASDVKAPAGVKQALNDAQMSALLGIIKSVSLKELSRNAAINLITSSLPISKEQAESIIEKSI